MTQSINNTVLLVCMPTHPLSIEDKAQVILGAAEQLLSSSASSPSSGSSLPLVLSAANISSGHAGLNVLFAGQLFLAASGLVLNQHVKEVSWEGVCQCLSLCPSLSPSFFGCSLSEYMNEYVLTAVCPPCPAV